MNDATAVGFVEAIGDLRAELQDLVERQGTFFEALGEGLAFDAFHDEIVDAVLMADVVEHANVGMIEAGNGFGFAFETLLLHGIGRKMRGKNLDGDSAVEAGVARAIDFSHAASAEWREDFVRA